MVERTADQRIRTTEWEDIQYKHGNKVGQYRDHEVEILAQKVADEHADALHRPYDPVEEKVRDKMARGGYDGDVNLDGSDDDLGAGIDDEDDALAEFRKKRLAEIQKAKESSLGYLKVISGSEYVAEISEASNKHWVVGLLTEQGHEQCEALAKVLSALAAKHRDVKFVAVPAAEALPKFPKKQFPLVVVYKDGKMMHQITTLEPWGGKRMDNNSAEQCLAEFGIVPRDNDDDDDEGGVHGRKVTKRFA